MCTLAVGLHLGCTEFWRHYIATDWRPICLDKTISLPAGCLHKVSWLLLQVYKRSFWTESFVQWSPKGSYVTTVHTRGVAVWGGPSFGRIQRLRHNQVIHTLHMELSSLHG